MNKLPVQHKHTESQVEITSVSLVPVNALAEKTTLLKVLSAANNSITEPAAGDRILSVSPVTTNKHLSLVRVIFPINRNSIGS